MSNLKNSGKVFDKIVKKVSSLHNAANLVFPKKHWLHTFFNVFGKKEFRDFFVRHIILMICPKKSQKIPQIFSCLACDLSTSSKKYF